MLIGKLARIILVLGWIVVALVLFFLVPSYQGELGDVLEIVFPFSTYSLCWVGFPIGWKAVRNRNPDNFVGAFFLGLLTMCLSLPIAVFQIFFKWD